MLSLWAGLRWASIGFGLVEEELRSPLTFMKVMAFHKDNKVWE